jgi:hypothetical protein
MDIATQEMLETIRRRIAKFQEFERFILAEFGEPASNGISAPIPSAPGRRQKRKRISSPVPLGGRKREIHDWLKQNGPAGRSEIVKGTGLPGGTVGGYLSSEKQLFESRDGMWHAL